MLRPPRLVVWDLGNVLIPWDRHGALSRLAEERGLPAEQVERLGGEVFTLEVNALLDSGRPVEAVRAAVEEASPGHGWVVDGYLRHFEHSLGGVITGSAALVEELDDAGVRCVGLSNWSSVTFEGIPETYPVLDRLDGILISGDVGICKPAPEIYRLCEERFGFAPTDALFVDDSPRNVEAAHDAGWDAVTFTRADALRSEMAARGLPVEPG